MKRRSFLIAAIAGALVLPAAARAADAPVTLGDLEISDGFARASPAMAKAGAGFMTIRSKGAGDSLIAFRSPACNTPELHTHINENGMMRMRQVERIDVPAGGEVKLEPGGLHLMFIDLTAPLEEGQMVPATLVFEKAGEVEVQLPVKKAGAMN